MTTLPAKTQEDKGLAEYVPFGQLDKIKLNASIVQTLIAKPTRSGKSCSITDAIKFIAMCKAKRLNPLEGDCYLVGYDNQKTGQAEFSQIVAHSTFLKRAEASENFDGMESGVLIESDGKIEQRPGDYYTEGENVVGGWATVHLKNRKIPFHDRLRLAAYAKDNQFWNKDAAGMIVKTSEASVLRKAFPTVLGGLYSPEESNFQAPSKPMEVSTEGLVQVVGEELPADELPPKETKQLPKSEAVSPRTKIANVVRASGFEFSDFQALAIKENLFKDPDSCAGFDDIPLDDAKRLARALEGIVNGLAQMKEGQ